MIVAETLRRNRKMTSTTRKTVSRSVNFTSSTDSRIGCARSLRIWSGHRGRQLRLESPGSSALMRSTTSTVLVPGCRWMAR